MSSISELQDEISSIRARLHRRNLVIDTIRNAYHKDVLLVKEQLMKATDRISKSDGYEVIDRNVLNSIPSIDLRPALDLFSPNECELRLKPCYSCGGRLEIVHRESSRIKQLEDYCKNLESVKNHLQSEVKIYLIFFNLTNRFFLMAINQNKLLHVQHESRITKTESSQIVEFRLLEAKRLNEEIISLNDILKDKEIIANDLQQCKKKIRELKEDIAQLEKKALELIESRETVTKLSKKTTSLNKSIRGKDTEFKELNHRYEIVKESESLLLAKSQSLNKQIIKLKAIISSLEILQDSLLKETNESAISHIE